jgi:hypothetical protein
MAVSEFTLVTLLTFLLGAGGSSDLLDYVPTDSYWQTKKVVVTPEILLAELAPPPPAANVDELMEQLVSADAAVRDAAAAKIRALGPAAVPTLQKEAASEDIEIARRAKSLMSEISADVKPASVRRLMAIRTLGERKERSALPLLRPMLESKEPFVAEYAKRAVAQIEGTPFERPVPTEAMKQDLWLLPQACAAVGQYAPRAGLAQRFDQAVALMHMSESQKKDRLQILTESVLELAEHVGNIRIDGITAGASADFGETTGYAVAIERGQFDRVAVGQRVREEGSPSGNVDGHDVFTLDEGGALFFLSDNQAVYMVAAPGVEPPTKELIAAASAGRGGLDKAEGMAALIKSAPTDQALWAAVKVTDAYRLMPMFAGFDTVSLVGRQQGATVNFQATAQGNDAKAVDASLQAFAHVHREALDGMKAIAPVMPPLQRVAKFLESVKTNPDGAKATATATFEGPVTRIIVFMNFPYATANPVEEGKPLPPPKPPEEAPLNPGLPQFKR